MTDTLLHCRYLIPVIPENCVLENHSIAISNGAITDLLPRQLVRQYLATRSTENINLPERFSGWRANTIGCALRDEIVSWNTQP